MTEEKMVQLFRSMYAGIARKIFEKYGYEVDPAPDGKEAIEMAQKNHYDAICMDIGLPTISGTSVQFLILKLKIPFPLYYCCSDRK